jgi:hypothetical protein
LLADADGVAECAMPTESGKPLIVISYAHADEPEKPAEGEVKWLSFVTGYLRPAIKHGAVELWLDRLMEGGADWEREIEAKLRACDVFILLVSRHSLASDYVVDKEIPVIRARLEKGEAVHFYPLVVTRTPNVALDRVRDRNLRPRDGTPLSELSVYERERHMNEAANEIAEIAMRAAVAKEAHDAPSPSAVAAGPRGSIYLASVTRIEPALKAAFVDYGGEKHAFLPFDEIHPDYFQVPAQERSRLIDALYRAPLREGLDETAPQGRSTQARSDGAPYKIQDVIKRRQVVLVQILREPRGDKGAAVTTVLSLAGKHVVLMPNTGLRSVSRAIADVKERSRLGRISASLDLPEGMGVVFRASSAKRTKAEITGDLAAVLRKWQAIRELTLTSTPPTLVYEDPPPEDDPPPEPERPAPLPNVEAPFAYGWTGKKRVAAIPGAQNLPFYPHFSSEEDHRRALEACRKGGERLLKALREGRFNARREYGEALEYYLDDLPKTAGAGNILLANDQVRILHAMFLADAEMLPEGFASRLKSVIANQFALNAFYDLVARHNAAVNAGNWSRPFPLDAAKGFFGAVEDNTPRWFEPQVEVGLREVEKAEPPAATASETAHSSAIEPPPLPPGTPDARDSWMRQMATAANALWQTFLEGERMPVDKAEWRKAAEELAPHVRPVVEFLRAQEGGKTLADSS